MFQLNESKWDKPNYTKCIVGLFLFGGNLVGIRIIEYVNCQCLLWCYIWWFFVCLTPCNGGKIHLYTAFRALYYNYVACMCSPQSPNSPKSIIRKFDKIQGRRKRTNVWVIHTCREYDIKSVGRERQLHDIPKILLSSI